MKVKRMEYLLTSCLFFPVAAHSQSSTTTPGKSEAGSASGRTHPAENQSVKTILFEKGSAKLTVESEKEIRTFINNAKAQGKVREVKVATWSDQETPLQAEKDLSMEDRRLAEERGEQIRNFLHNELHIRDVTIFNMAHGTSKLAELLHTEESELRMAFSHKGNDKKMRPEVKLIRDHGKPSAAVLLVEHDMGRAS